MFTHPRSYPATRPDSGFSLVEIMVGMVIGMLGLVIMMQVFTLSEGQKRSTTGGGDAQSGGAIALFGLQRDLRQAGFGITDVKLAGCDLTLPANATRGQVVLTNLGPVTINHPLITGHDNSTDTLLIVYGNSNGSPQGDGILSQTVQTSYVVKTPTSYNSGDYVIATPAASAASLPPPIPCPALTLDRVNGPPVVIPPSTNGVLNVLPGVPGVSNGTLYNLGQSPKILAYAIRGGNLTLCDFMRNDCSAAGNNGNAMIWVPVASNIASIRAQYGRDMFNGLNPADLKMDGIVDRYDNWNLIAANNPAWPALPLANMNTVLTACVRIKISAVRIVLVARNANYEKTIVTANAPAWEASAAYAAPNPPTAADRVSWSANPIDLTENIGLTAPASWQNYRYKVLQTVVPLRNLTLAWQGVPTGC